MNLDSTTVKDLKVLLAPETGLPVDDQILVYDGETLSGEITIETRNQCSLRFYLH